jgi:hypothetical protein
MRKISKDEMFPDIPGERLPNGAIILDEDVYAEVDDENSGNIRRSTVLCAIVYEYGHAIPRGHQTFVTWDRWVSRERTATGGHRIVDTCLTGQYTSDLSDAIMDYAQRRTAAWKRWEAEDRV